MAWLYCSIKKEITVYDLFGRRKMGKKKKKKLPGVSLLKLKAKVFDVMSRAVEICNSFHLLPLVHENDALLPAAYA